MLLRHGQHRLLGKLADLIVIDGDPLRDIRATRSVRWVMRGGRVYDARELLRSVEGALGPPGGSAQHREPADPGGRP